MRCRQPVPRLWLLTDERLGEALLPAVAALPRGAGVVFRHYSLPPAERRALFGRVRSIARRRRLMLVVAGPPALATRWGADGSYGPPRRNGGVPRIATAHTRVELMRARRTGAAAAMLSPVHPTRSHVGASTLGRARFGLLARTAGIPVIALGGMTEARFRSLPAGAYSWAGIDAWLPKRIRT